MHKSNGSVYDQLLYINNFVKINVEMMNFDELLSVELT